MHILSGVIESSRVAGVSNLENEMTISKERLNTLIVEKARERCSHYDSNAVAGACIFEFRLYDLLDFANTLLKAVEAEAEVVGHGLFSSDGKCHVMGQHKSSMCINGKAFKSSPLIALPLVEGN
jgi:hypothetical protein